MLGAGLPPLEYNCLPWIWNVLVILASITVIEDWGMAWQIMFELVRGMDGPLKLYWDPSVPSFSSSYRLLLPNAFIPNHHVKGKTLMQTRGTWDCGGGPLLGLFIYYMFGCLFYYYFFFEKYYIALVGNIYFLMCCFGEMDHLKWKTHMNLSYIYFHH